MKRLGEIAMWRRYASPGCQNRRRQAVPIAQRDGRAMTACGPFATSQLDPPESAFGSKPDQICSHLVLRLLARSGHTLEGMPTPLWFATAEALGESAPGVRLVL